MDKEKKYQEKDISKEEYLRLVYIKYLFIHGIPIKIKKRRSKMKKTLAIYLGILILLTIVFVKIVNLKNNFEPNWVWKNTLIESVAQAPSNPSGIKIALVTSMPEKKYSNTEEVRKALLKTGVKADIFYIITEQFDVEDILSLVKKECTKNHCFSSMEVEVKSWNYIFTSGQKIITTRIFSSGKNVITLKEISTEWGYIYTILTE